ncbi:MAG: PEGA domain-containing protein [Candidatus Omnitrophota bacterium]
MGVVINPKTHQLVKTGIIYVSSNPPNADVYINDLKAHENTPCIIRDLPPDNYVVRLELKSYQPWQNKIMVVEHKATVLENILLIPKQWAVRTLSGLPLENILPLGDGNTLLTWQTMSVKDLYLLRLNKEASNDKALEPPPSEVNAVFPDEFIYSDSQILRFFTVEKSPFFILHILVANKHKYLWVDVRDKQVHIEDISDLLPLEPLRLLWEAGDDKIIYAYYSDHINRIDIKAKAIYPDIPAQNVPQKKETSLYVPNMTGEHLNEDNNMWLEFSPNKIGLWDKNQKSMQWIYQDGNNISQAFWANNGNTIIFRDNNEVFLLDKEPFGHIRLQKITDITPGSSIYYSEKTGKLYYITPKEKFISAIIILRHKPMLPKTIADTLRLKEFEP